MDGVSKEASEIISAGIAALADETNSEAALAKVDKAVHDAAGRMYVQQAGNSTRPIVDALIEIAQLYVREKAAKGRNGSPK